MESFVESVMESLGASGIVLLMFLENIFPPLPSELIMPLAGYRSAQGDMPIAVVIAAGSVGSLLGAVPWYWAGRAIGKERLKRFARDKGRWLTLSPEDVEAADRWFRAKGPLAVLFGRLIPTVRTLISIPAGLAHMPLPKFLIYSAIGTLAWTAALALGGYLLGQTYHALSGWLDLAANGVLAAAVALYLYRVVRFAPGRATEVRPRPGEE